MLFMLCTVLFRFWRFLYIYYTWKTLLNHVFEDLRKTKAPNRHATWTSSMSSFMLSYLSNVVSSGERTSSGFKKVHYNSCAKAINEKFQIALNGEQIKNHLKTWSRRFAKINRIRKVSGTGWDEDNFIITLDEEHNNGFIKVRNQLPQVLCCNTQSCRP